MKDFEILRVQMDTQPAQETSSYLEELFERLKEQFAKTGKQFASALAGVGTQAKGMLTTVLKTYKQMAYGLDSVTKGSLKRTVAGFDQLNRLAKSTGSAVSKEDRSLMQGFSHLADKLQQAGTKLRENLFEPLTQIPQQGLSSGDADTLQKALPFFQKCQQLGFFHCRLLGSIQQLTVVAVWTAKITPAQKNRAGDFPRIIQQCRFFAVRECPWRLSFRVSLF